MQARARTVLTFGEAIEAAGRPDAETVVKAALDANLLALDGDESVKFAHQLLQEYFAVRILLEAFTLWETDPTQPTAASFFEPWWKPGVWRETTVILGELLGDGAVGANRAARWLAGVTPEIALDVILRNGAGLTLTDVADDTCVALVQGAKYRTGEPNPVGQAAAYRVLGVFDADDRFGLGLGADGLPEFDWVDIPSGAFLYGDERESDNPPRKLTLPRFQISRYPVTYAQFQAFIDAPDGFHDPRWWDGLAASPSHKSAPREQAFKFWNHPREMVSWYDAIAFCRWLSYKLGGKWGLHEVDEWLVRLPTEFEWEKAARGTDGREYPYEGGFDRNKGNSRETGIGQTSAVGIFPEGKSPYGLLDMSGNVWEWCLSAYKDPKLNLVYESLRNADSRVLRGGSWLNSQVNLRAANRLYDTPDNGNFFIGFRCARSPERSEG
jgi:formylglycine-generating enzyme required for sulfatase activity